MANKKGLEKASDEMPKTFNEHDKNMDGTDKEAPAYQEHRKIGPEPSDKPLKNKEKR